MSPDWQQEHGCIFKPPQLILYRACRFNDECKIEALWVLSCWSTGLAGIALHLVSSEDCIALLLLILVRAVVVVCYTWPKNTQSNFLCC